MNEHNDKELSLNEILDQLGDGITEEAQPLLFRALTKFNSPNDYRTVALSIQTLIIRLVRSNDIEELTKWVVLLNKLRFEMKLRISDYEQFADIDVKLWTLRDFIESGIQSG